VLKSLKLQGVGPVRNLTALFGERLIIITGDNGLGKSFLLDVCFWSLTGTWPGGRIAMPGGKLKAPTIIYRPEVAPTARNQLWGYDRLDPGAVEV